MKLQKLPDNFTYTQAEMVRLQNDFGKKGTAMMLRNWVNRHYIEKIHGYVDGREGHEGNGSKCAGRDELHVLIHRIKKVPIGESYRHFCYIWVFLLKSFS